MISDINIRVNRDLCYACGICVERCILDNLRLSVAPCRQRCPIDMNCQGYVRLIAQGKEREAVKEMGADAPFGSILGRVCHHPCEEACERGKLDGAVHIRALKRYLSDSFPELISIPSLRLEESGRSVAVVGSGPAGLTAAFDARSKGHRVTVFEADSNPGGLLRYGIPSFRLPIGVVERLVGFLEAMGVSFRTGEALGRDFDLSKLEAEYGAVILAVGAGKGAVLNIPEREQTGVVSGLDLLRAAKEGNAVSLGGSVIVIGGGNSAVDAALTCKKLGATDVRIVALEDRSQMPAFELEVEEALEEGIKIENGWGPTRFQRKEDGRIGVELSRCLSVFDPDGRFNPRLEPFCGHTLEAEAVVVAIGQRFENNGLPQEILNPETGKPWSDPVTAQSAKHEKVFIAGDCATGARSVVEAMASGRQAALSVDRFLRGEGLRWGRTGREAGRLPYYEVDLSRAKGKARGRLRRVEVAARALNREVEEVLSAEEARIEAERCLSCGRAAEINRTCWYCLPCEIECPVNALEVRIPYLVR